MKLTVFEIKFDKPQGVFEAGTTVSGQVILDLEKPMKMRSLKLYIVGQSKSWWDEKNGKNTTKYRAHENYLNTYVVLISSDNPNSSSIEHPAGCHLYPFSVQLPPNIPSSFEGRRGYVRYFCKATIDRPWKFDSHIKRAFTVIKHLDLNMYPDVIMPSMGEVHEEMEGCCCSDGAVNMSFRVNKSGFVPGEPIVYDISIDNQSDRTINNVQVELFQIIKYTGYSNSFWSSGRPHFHPKEDRYTLYNQMVVVRSHTNLDINQSTLTPSLPPSHLDGCGIIDIQYSIRCKVKCGGDDCTVWLKTIIGTIPTREPSFPSTNQMFPVAPSDVGITVPPVEPSAPPPGLAPPSYEDALAMPPSYSECVFGPSVIRDEDDDDHTDGDVNWAPAYPYYDWTNHSSAAFGGNQQPTTVQQTSNM